IPNTSQTRFEIASLSKQFTAAAILQLADAGRLSLDDPVGKYYKEAPQGWHGITIHQLLTHTSGIPNNEIKDFTKGIAAPYTLDELVLTFRDKPLAFAPGTKWASRIPNITCSPISLSLCPGKNMASICPVIFSSRSRWQIRRLRRH